VKRRIENMRKLEEVWPVKREPGNVKREKKN